MRRAAERAVALLLAAHGERRDGARNRGVARLAADLAARGVAAAVEVGFLKGMPSIGEAVRRLVGYDLLVYPLFLSDGYFTQSLLPQRLTQAGAFDRGGKTDLLPPLGLDPALADLILRRARLVAASQGLPAARTELVLLAHGSTGNPASRAAAERIARSIAERHAFARIHTAFLEEPPLLKEALATSQAPAVVVGLFAGDGLHGGGDAPQHVARLARSDVVFAGTIGDFEELPEAIASAIARSRRAEPALAAVAPDATASAIDGALVLRSP